MDFFELETQFRGNVPAESGAEDAGPKIVETVVWVAKHDCEIFGDVVEQNMERMHAFDDGVSFENAIVEDVTFLRAVT